MSSLGFTAHRADNRRYDPILYYNILTYIYGCSFGIAVIAQAKRGVFNPNISMEVGYMLALEKPVCLLKDSTFEALQADLAGMQYHEFDSRHCDETIEPALKEWLEQEGPSTR